MDYYNIYKDQFDSNWESLKNNAIDRFKLAKSIKANFHVEFESLIKGLDNDYDEIFDEIKKNDLTECFRLLNKRASLIDNSVLDDEKIDIILSNHVLEEYKNQGYSAYDEFLIKLANIDSTNKIKMHFDTYYKYYELVYFTGKFDYFYGEPFDGKSFSASKEYLEMMFIKDPDSVKTIGVPKDLFSENDKFLILHTLILLIKKGRGGVSSIEIARVLVLANIDNQKILSEDYRNVDGYKILSSGIDKLNSDSAKKKWISDILDKLEPYKLTAIKGELRLLIRKLNKK